MGKVKKDMDQMLANGTRLIWDLFGMDELDPRVVRHDRLVTCALPVISPVCLYICGGVLIIANEPVKIIVGSESDCFHLLLRHVPSISIKVPKYHNVLWKMEKRSQL
eukprot:g43277.t1